MKKMKIEDTEKRNNRVGLHHADVYTYNTNSFTCSNCGGQMSQQRGGLMRCHYAKCVEDVYEQNI
tara:strand:+ start:305 stop:499 length:195 start_codon:yes stop_codon:yes gene_type:complete